MDDDESLRVYDGCFKTPRHKVRLGMAQVIWDHFKHIPDDLRAAAMLDVNRDFFRVSGKIIPVSVYGGEHQQTKKNTYTTQTKNKYETTNIQFQKKTHKNKHDTNNIK